MTVWLQRKISSRQGWNHGSLFPNGNSKVKKHQGKEYTDEKSCDEKKNEKDPENPKNSDAYVSETMGNKKKEERKEKITGGNDDEENRKEIKEMDYGIKGLIESLKTRDSDMGMLSLGLDFSILGLTMEGNSPLSSSFITPWDDSTERINQILPRCYSMAKPPALQSKLPQFTESSLFYLFYSFTWKDPKTIPTQDIVSQELYKRGWRWHLVDHIWIYHDDGWNHLDSTISAKHIYVVFDSIQWTKINCELQIQLGELMAIDY